VEIASNPLLQQQMVYIYWIHTVC